MKDFFFFNCLQVSQKFAIFAGTNDSIRTKGLTLVRREMYKDYYD